MGAIIKVKVMGEVTLQSHNVRITSYQLTSLLFHVNRASHSLITTFQNLTMKIKGQGHGWGHTSKTQCWFNIISTHIPFIPNQLGIPFLSYDYFQIWPWKYRVKVMGGVTVQSHNVGLISYWLTFLSLHINRPFRSWDTAFSKSDLENPGSRSNDHDVAQLQVKTIP